MKKNIIKKNKRRVSIFNFLYYLQFFLFNKNKSLKFRKSFNFTETCKYYFDDSDQHDVNKLFGFSVGHHHNNSFRFGWRYNKEKDKIEIVGYLYLNKKRIPTIPITFINFNEFYNYGLEYINNSIKFRISRNVNNEIINSEFNEINFKKKYYIGYKLGIYFGGNKKAPHEMIILEK